MSTPNNRSIFAIVDTLNVALSSDGSKLEGQANNRPKNFPIPMNFPVVVRSDFMKEGEVAVFAKLRGNLWAYVYAKDKDKTTDLWMILFDGGTQDIGFYKTGVCRKTLQLILKHQKVMLQFDGDKWFEVDSITLPT